VEAISKGENGHPGEIRGKLQKDRIGELYANTDCGIFGNMEESASQKGETVFLAFKDSVTTGKATIFCTLDDSGKQEYEIEIEEILAKDRKNKNFIVHITDPDLIEKTGGIVQGMSGSPIIQNGKLVGAITHVLVGDPTRGYGIFIENMLSAMPAA
jgi:stage IV sporulation protein B